MTFALGYGVARDWRQISGVKAGGDEGVAGAIDAFEDEYAFASPFLGEFSLGYAF